MGVESLEKWVTVTGAVVAAVTGVWNLLLQFRGKRDVFVVRLGSVSPTVERETILHVVSHSDHSIKITDCGFIERNGSFCSIRMCWEAGSLQTDEITHRGSSDLAARSDIFETGYVRSEETFGVYAISATSRYPQIYFHSIMPYWRRIFIRGRLRFQRDYLAW